MNRKFMSFLVAIMLFLFVCPFVAYGAEGEEVVADNKEDILAESLNENHSDRIIGDVVVLDENNEENNVEEINFDEIDFKVEEFKFKIQSNMNSLRRAKEKLDYDGALEITGSIHYPFVQKYDKVFFFIHGRMHYNPFAHHGFDYVIERLNYEGYRVISLNISDIYHSPEDVDGEIENVIKAVNETLKYIKKSKSDFGDIKVLSFVGHSRAGFHVLKIADDLGKKGYIIENILSIAPYVMDWENLSFPDIETTIIVPEFDGDVSDLDGYKLYDEGAKINRKSLLRCIYLYGGNHNFFSTEMLNDDSEDLNLSDIYNDYKLTRTIQEKFLKDFILRYMTTDENHDIIIGVLYNCREYNSSYKVKNLDNITINLSNSTLKNIYVDKDDMSEFDVTWFIEPGFESNRYNIMTFQSENSYIVFDVLNGNYSDLMFEIALDTTKTHLDGVEVEVIVDYTNKKSDSFLFVPFDIGGELIEVGRHEAYWSREIPFEQFFFDINESYRIDKITLKCNKPAQFILGDIFLKKP